jgi:putative chitinase
MTNAPSGAAISLALIQKIVGKMTKAQVANANSVVIALDKDGPAVGLDRPHRLAHFLAQVLHESGTFTYDHELWGPTPAQKRYEGRTDLGNVQKGDGSRYRGRGPIQITGRVNYRTFTAWAKKIDPKAPNFEKTPEAVVTDPWEGLGPIWYWDAGNPDHASLNRYADDNNIEMVTRRINGGLNGYADRLNWYVRTALVMLGYGPAEIKRFQQDHPEAGAADGVAGEKTRMALHKALSGANPYREVETVEKEVRVPVPVDQPVVPTTVDQEVKQKTNWLTYIFGAGGIGSGAIAFLKDADWQTIVAIGGSGVVAGGLTLLAGQWIVRRIKTIRREWEG